MRPREAAAGTSVAGNADANPGGGPSRPNIWRQGESAPIIVPDSFWETRARREQDSPMNHAPRSRAAAWRLLFAVLGGLPHTASGGSGRGYPTPSALPQTLVVQPAPANATDTWILNTTPTWNYGDNTSLFVGPD